jgi:hypothetical protein
MDRKDILTGLLNNDPEAIVEAQRVHDRLERQAMLKEAAASKSNAKGKLNRKSIYKHLEKSNKRFAELSMKLREAKRQAEALNAQIKSYENGIKDSKDDISMCHDVLRNMDFANASDVLINNNEDIAYVVDGRKMYFDTKDHSLISYSKWKKQNRKDDEPEYIESDDADISDIQDFNFDGFDITR